MRSHYIPTLDGWRAIAILMVLYEHAASCTLHPAGWSVIGGHGVEVFFVLSGFLITGKLYEDASLKRFYLRRAFRILPILLCYLLVVSIVGLILHRIPLDTNEILASLLFVRHFSFYPNLIKTGAGWFTGHLWSLSTEEQFYLLWPLLFLKFGKDSTQRRALALLALFAVGVFTQAMLFAGQYWQLFGWHWGVDLRVGGLLLGCSLRVLFSHDRARYWISKALSSWSLPAFLGFCAYVWYFRHTVTPFDSVVCTIVIACTLTHPYSLMGRFLELSPLRWIGRLSYSLYVWQQIFLGFGVVYRPFGWLSTVPANLAMAFVIACASYYWLERPLQQWGHRLAKQPAESSHRQQLKPYETTPVVHEISLISTSVR